MQTLAFFGQIAGDRSECVVEPVGQSANLFGRVLGFCQRAAHGWPRGLPGSTIEQANTGIAETQARRCENVPAPKRSAQPIVSERLELEAA